MRNYKFLLATLGMILMISMVNISKAEEKPYSGTIKGRIVDADTKQPLAGANIIILTSNLGAASDQKGNFIIEEVKQILQDPNKQILTLLSIAYDAGFNSKSGFNAIFKRSMKLTPSEYREKISKA